MVLVTPLPGVDRKHLYTTLQAVHTDVSNQWTGGPHGHLERLLAYLDWANSAVERLGSLIRSSDLERLVLTKRYELLLSGVGDLANEETRRLTNSLVSIELKQRVDAFEAAVKELGWQLVLWEQRGQPVVADSSFYIEHPHKFEEADFAAVTGISEDSIHLLVPMVVVDELDDLKRSRDQHQRWRAGYTLAVLDRLFQISHDRAVLHEPDPESVRLSGIRRGEVTVSLIFDPPGHVRLPINDDEIVDRAAAVKPLAGRQVTLLTYDTGQASRGRRAELNVIKLSKPVGEEADARDTAAKNKVAGT
jgi:hypothetical protein